MAMVGIGHSLAQDGKAKPDAVQKAFAQSLEQERLLDYSAAINSLLALDNAPDDQYLIELRLGWLHYLKADYGAADRYYQQAIRLAPDATEPRIGRLLPLLAQKRYGEVIDAARTILELDPKNYYANMRLAYALRMQGEFDEAASIISRQLELQRTDLTLLAELGLAEQGRKNTVAAREAFETLLTLDPSNRLARAQLGLPEPAVTKPVTAADKQSLTSLPKYSVTEPEFQFSVLTSIAALDYGAQSIKNNGIASGVYLSASYINILEFSFDYTHINYRSGANLDQEDYTLVYSYLEEPNLKLRIGGHAIGSTDPFGNGSWIAFGGASYYETDAWDFGVDAYHSHYEDSSFSLDVNQITPHVALEHRFADLSRMRLETLGYYINVGSDIDLGKQDFYSLETRWRLAREYSGISFFAWTGQQTFAVRRDGFLVYNLGEEHHGGYGGDVYYNVSDNTIFTLRVTNELFSDFATGLGTHQFVVAALLTRTF